MGRGFHCYGSSRRVGLAWESASIGGVYPCVYGRVPPPRCWVSTTEVLLSPAGTMGIPKQSVPLTKCAMFVVQCIRRAVGSWPGAGGDGV